jgi:hypothetical protein
MALSARNPDSDLSLSSAAAILIAARGAGKSQRPSGERSQSRAASFVF